MLKELRDFILRGSAFDLAVALVLSVAFGAVVVAFTEGVLMALVAAIFGKPDFNALSFDLNGTPIQYGRVLTALVNFVLIATAVFVVVKLVNRIRKPATTETDHDLLEQIRDELHEHRPSA